MPYVNVKLAGKISREQKEEVVKQITDVLYKVIGKDPKKTYVVLEEIERGDWGVGGELLG